MRARFWRMLTWLCVGATCAAAGCVFGDPDVQLRAGLSAASDLAIFLLENAVAGM